LEEISEPFLQKSRKITFCHNNLTRKINIFVYFEVDFDRMSGIGFVELWVYWVARFVGFAELPG
jgi:hypothetical protein